MLLAALAAGLAGGVAGGLIVAVADDGGDAPAAVATPAAAPVAATPEASAPRLRSAIARVLPAVVTVVADHPPRRDEQGAVVQRRSVGSGVVLDDRGHVATNFHVIDGAAELGVLLSTGERRPASVVSHDAPYSDLAVLRIPPAGLRSAALGDSSLLRHGDPVAVVAGAGFAAGNSVKVGVVSGVGREWPRNGVVLEDLVQTDAPVNHGDSGGALVNADGEVVGLLTTVVRALPDGRSVEGVAFAQSSNSLRDIVGDIVLLGSYLRPRLGIEHPFRHHVELTPQRAAERGIPLSLGALVIAVEAGSAATAAGIRPGDIVVAVNGAAVDLERPFVNLVKELDPAATAELTVVRAGVRLSVPVIPRLE